MILTDNNQSCYLLRNDSDQLDKLVIVDLTIRHCIDSNESATGNVRFCAKK